MDVAVDLPRTAWIPVTRPSAITPEMEAVDPKNFSVCIDGARFLPGNVYFSRVKKTCGGRGFY